MADPRTRSGYATLTLRFTVGVIFLYHGSRLLFGAFDGPGFNRTAGWIESGLGFAPGWLFAIVLGGTIFLSGLALMIGMFTRIAAIIAGVSAGLSLFWADWDKILFSNEDPPVTFALLLIGTATAVYFLGAGPFSVDRKIARERADADS